LKALKRDAKTGGERILMAKRAKIQNDNLGPKIRAGSMVIDGNQMQNNMFTLLNSTNRSPLKNDFVAS
jgi:hypothetical protein